MTLEQSVPYIGAVLAIVTLLRSEFNVKVIQERRITAIETKIDVFWRIIEEKALEILHHPSRMKLDKYIDEYKAGTITTERLREFTMMLDLIVRDKQSDPNDVFAATMMLANIAQKHRIVCVG